MPAPGAILGPHTTSSKTPVPQGAAKLWARLMQGMALIMEGGGGSWAELQEASRAWDLGNLYKRQAPHQ